jgi:hypothetical protein
VIVLSTSPAPFMAPDVPAVVVSDDGRVAVVGHPSGRRDHIALSALVRRLQGRGRAVVVSQHPVTLQRDGNGWRIASPTPRTSR